MEIKNKAQNELASVRGGMPVKYRPDEKTSAPDNARLRGSHQQVRSLKKAKHRKARRK